MGIYCCQYWWLEKIKLGHLKLIQKFVYLFKACLK